MAGHLILIFLTSAISFPLLVQGPKVDDPDTCLKCTEQMNTPATPGPNPGPGPTPPTTTATTTTTAVPPRLGAFERCGSPKDVNSEQPAYDLEPSEFNACATCFIHTKGAVVKRGGTCDAPDIPPEKGVVVDSCYAPNPNPDAISRVANITYHPQNNQNHVYYCECKDSRICNKLFVNAYSPPPTYVSTLDPDSAALKSSGFLPLVFLLLLLFGMRKCIQRIA